MLANLVNSKDHSGFPMINELKKFKHVPGTLQDEAFEDVNVGRSQHPWEDDKPKGIPVAGMFRNGPHCHISTVFWVTASTPVVPCSMCNT